MDKRNGLLITVHCDCGVPRDVARFTQARSGVPQWRLRSLGVSALGRVVLSDIDHGGSSDSAGTRSGV